MLASSYKGGTATEDMQGGKGVAGCRLREKNTWHSYKATRGQLLAKN